MTATISRFAPVDTQGHELRGDVAAALLRAQSGGGMPVGGIDVYRRTLDEQRYLYDHQPPLAAYPSFHAPHVDGRAVDFHTTTGSQYTPSKSFLWATQGGVGRDKPKPGEKLQINKYGFYRSVPSERWHLEYNPKLDRYRSGALVEHYKRRGFATLKDFQKAVGLVDDGIDGPLTWTALLTLPLTVEVPPVVTPPVGPQPVMFRFGSYNAQLKHFGGGSAALDAAFIDDVLKPSVLAGQEVDEKSRNEICDATGFKVYPLGTVAIFFSPSKYTWGARIEKSFGTPYHGLIATRLVSKGNGNDFVAGSVHIRPRAAFSSDAAAAKGKAADVDKVIAELAKYPRVIVGGDWSHDVRKKMEAAGYHLVTPWVDTYDKPGIQRLDAVFAKGLEDRTGGSEHSTAASDHDGVLANMTLPAPVSTN